MGNILEAHTKVSMNVVESLHCLERTILPPLTPPPMFYAHLGPQWPPIGVMAKIQASQAYSGSLTTQLFHFAEFCLAC